MSAAEPATVGDLEPDPAAFRHRQLGEPVAVYPYRRASGDVAFVVCRFDPKDFRPAQRRNGRVVWNLDGAAPLPYRLPELEAALAAGETIWIVDGEKDADALAEFGVAATCCARSQGWTLELAEQLTGARHIRIVADRDQNGVGARQAHTVLELLVRGGAIASSDVELVQAAVGKDAFDHLAAGRGLDDFEPVSAEDEPDAVRHSWRPVDLFGGDAQPPDPPTIGGIVYPGRRHWCTGEPESLKTMGAAALAVEEIRAGRNVVYVDFENGHREMLARFRALGATDKQIATQLDYLEPAEALTTPEVLADVRARLADRQPSLVVIDSAAGALALHGCDPNSGADIERFYRTVVDELRSHGAAVLVLDHLVKDREARGRYAIGSERKIGAADVHLRFTIVEPLSRGRVGRVSIETKKDRPGHLRRPRAAELELASDADTGAMTYTFRLPADDDQTSPFRPTVLMERVSRYVANCVEPPSRNQVEKGVKGSTDGKRLAIDVLIRDGYLAPERGPHGASLLRLIRPYTQADDTSSSPPDTRDDLASSSPTAEPREQAETTSSPILAPSSPNGRGEDLRPSPLVPIRDGAIGEVEDEDAEQLAATTTEHLPTADGDIPF